MPEMTVNQRRFRPPKKKRRRMMNLSRLRVKPDSREIPNKEPPNQINPKRSTKTTNSTLLEIRENKINNHSLHREQTRQLLRDKIEILINLHQEITSQRTLLQIAPHLKEIKINDSEKSSENKKEFLQRKNFPKSIDF